MTYYGVKWPIEEHARDTHSVRELKEEARRDLVVMLHEAGLIPIGPPAVRITHDRKEIAAIVQVVRSPGKAVAS